MRNGLYADYLKKVYQVSDIDGDKIRLVSKDKNDKELGFKLKVYPDFYKEKENLPRLYIKEVIKKDLNDLFELSTLAIYKNNKFEFISKSKDRVLLGTTDAALANKLKFDRTDKYYYEKWVSIEDVELFEEKTEINL
ncbi:hypothetical protein KQI49_02930 [Virgibacillus sp. MSJ-26]|uniref:hypothetical protein n=1 Tax=Virgibacillus sp. MSJ-26 TaxID=2841522 RepID=UPI001C110DD0|nr:hypothetical protein [Virgibacillus sp. MSJ-26]MBU5465781.1 hypothetical protein [Virgibacillus sp. MSJ-26]